MTPTSILIALLIVDLILTFVLIAFFVKHLFFDTSIQVIQF